MILTLPQLVFSLSAFKIEEAQQMTLPHLSHRSKSHQRFIRFRFHDLRHMFAINYLRDGGNVYHLQIEMGHSTIRQTEEYLQYLTAEEQVAANGVSQQVPHTTAVSRGRSLE